MHVYKKRTNLLCFSEVVLEWPTGHHRRITIAMARKTFKNNLYVLSNYEKERNSGLHGSSIENARYNCDLGISSSVFSGTLLEEYSAKKTFDEQGEIKTSC